jgi:hypothetical protein
MTAAADLGPFAGTAARTSLRSGTAPIARRRPALELVAPARTDARRGPFAAVVVSLLVAGLLGLLVLNTVLAKGAFALHTLSQESRDLADREQTLSREVEALRSPQALAGKAAAMGMVPAGPPAFLELPSGKVSGVALPALAPGEVRTDSGEVVAVAPEPEPEAAVTAADDAGTDDTAGDDTAGNDADATSADETQSSDQTTTSSDEIPAGDDR